MGTEIAKLLPEVQLRVNSNPDKYDPNGNGQIDDGEELSTLLSEYGKSSIEDLSATRNRLVYLKTYGEKEAIDNKRKKENDTLGTVLAHIIQGGGGFAAATAFIAGLAMNKTSTVPIPKNAMKALGVGLVVNLAVGLFNRAMHNKKIFNGIKAEQADKAEDIRQEKRAKEEEMRQREAALKQQELEYQQGMDTATKNIEQQVSSAQRRACQLNAELKEARAQVDSLTAK